MARRSCAPRVLDRSRRGLGRVFAGAQRIDLNPRLAQPVAQHADLVFELDLAQARDPLVGQAGRCAVAARPLRWLAGMDRLLALAAPAGPAPIDLLDWLLYPVLGAEVGDRPLALLDQPVVVDDQVATRRETAVERLEGELGGLVSVAVEADHRPAPVPEAGEGLVEKARHEPDPFAEA